MALLVLVLVMGIVMVLDVLDGQQVLTLLEVLQQHAQVLPALVLQV